MTRAVAQAGMLPKGSGAGYTRHCQKVRKKILMVQQFLLNYIMESLILAQNERWRRG